MVPRIALMFALGGELAQPTMDQELYLRLAGTLLSGHGLSFGPEIGRLKAVNGGEGEVASSWASNPDYVFGLARTGTQTATVEPGYPAALALFFMLLGRTSGAVFLLNTLAQTAGAWAMFLLGERAGGRRTGLLAALGFAFYPYFIFYTATAMTEALHVAMIPVLALLTLRTLEDRRGGFAAGAAAGLLFLIRSTVLVLIPVQLFLFLRRRMLRQSLMLVAGFAVLTAPWVIRNAVEMGMPILLPTKGSVNLWMRNNPEALRMEGIEVPQAILSGVRHRELLEYPDESVYVGELARSAELSRRARAFMIANPGLVAWLSGQRLLSFLSPFPESGAGGLPTELVGLLVYLPISLLALAAALRRTAGTGTTVACAFFVAYLLVHTLAHGGLRYRLPVDTMLIYLAATAAGRGFRPA